MFIFLSCFSRFVRPCYYAPEKGKKVPRKNFLPLSPVQISLVTPSFDKISELGKRKILPANEANVRETQTRLDLSIHSRPLACLVGKTFPRFGCIALRAYLFSATGAGSFKSATGRIRRGEPGATPQGNVAREDERCSDLSFDVEAVRESGGEDGKRRSRQVGKIGRRRYRYLGQLWPGSRTRPQMNYR